MVPRALERLFTWYVERRASRIGDPVARLGYLRRSTRVPARFAKLPKLGVQRLVAGTALMVAALLVWRWVPTTGAVAPNHQPNTGAVSGQAPAPVWMVEQKREFELYSNGLRVERPYETSNVPRGFVAFARRKDARPDHETRREPIGIVYHTSESRLAPFDDEHTQALRQNSKALLEFAHKGHLYHYVIDRFGRVWRVVPESDAAAHAGYSIWADGEWIYINLNHSFLGIAFEGQNTDAESAPKVTAAQVRSARSLTEMLRARYRIRAENCVTHVQVSVSPVANQVGYHTDWVANFPFAELGLPNNYQQPLPSMVLFGFEYEQALLEGSSPELAKALMQGENQFRRAAEAAALTEVQYRKTLRKEYRRVSALAKEFAPAKESD
jgi:hypothetical protein